MKNVVLNIASVMLLCSYAYAHSIDYMNSLVISPRNDQTVSVSNPLVVGIMRDVNKRPVRNRRVTIWVDKRKVATVRTNRNGIWSYILQNGQALADGAHLVQASIDLAVGRSMWSQASLFYVQENAQLAHRSGNASATYSTIDYPFEQGVINTALPVIVGSVLSASYAPVVDETVSVKLNNVTLETVSTDANGVFSYQVVNALSEEGYTVSAHCEESDIDLPARSFTVDTTAPAAPTIVVPAQDSTLTNSIVTVSGTTEPFATVTTFLNEDTFGDVSYADEYGNWSIEYELANGEYSITAQQSDLGQNSSDISAARTFTVNA